jgi:hypothetical protein
MKVLGVDRRRRRGVVLALAVLAGALVVVACSNEPPANGALAPGTMIEHYHIGAPLDCSASAASTCDDYLRVALDTATTKRGIAPDAIMDHAFYQESIPDTTEGSSPHIAIVVLDISDGSRVAVGVYCGVGPCQVVDR